MLDALDCALIVFSGERGQLESWVAHPRQVPVCELARRLNGRSA